MNAKIVFTEEKDVKRYLDHLIDRILMAGAWKYMFGSRDYEEVIEGLIKFITKCDPVPSIGEYMDAALAIGHEHSDSNPTADMLLSIWEEHVAGLSDPAVGYPAAPAEATPPTTSDPDMQLEVNMNRIALGHIISDYLRENKITITALADAAGISREQVGWLMTGKRDPRISTVLQVFAAMGYSLMFEREK